MNDERFEALAALHAVGALDEPGESEFAALLANAGADEKCAVTGLVEVAALVVLSQSAPHEPPAGLKAKILQKIGKPAVQAPTAPSATASPSLAETGFKFLFAAEQGDWRPLKYPGAWAKLLSLDPVRGYAVVLGKLDAGASYPAHPHQHAEQLYMLTGDLTIDGTRLKAGDFHSAAAGSEHDVNSSEHGCTLLAVLSTADLQMQMA